MADDTVNYRTPEPEPEPRGPMPPWIDWLLVAVAAFFMLVLGALLLSWLIF